MKSGKDDQIKSDAPSEALRGLFFMEFSDSYTGGPQVLVNFLSTIDREEINPIVITNCRSQMTAELDKLNVPCRIISLPQGLEARKGETLRDSLPSKIRHLMRTLSYNRQISRILTENQIQFVWVRNVKGVLLTGMAARRARLPLIWDIGMEKESRGLVAALHLTAFLLSRIVVAEAGVVFEQVFPRWMRRIFRKKLTTNLSGISETRIEAIERCRRQKRNPDRIHVLNIASVNPRKNQLMLLEAVHRARIPDLFLSIAGPVTDSQYHRELTDFVAANALKNIEFLGWRDDIPELLGSADLFVICSDNEGVPYAVLEAMQASMPIIATRAGGIPDVITNGETGTLIDRGDVEALAQSLADFSERPEVYHSFAIAAKKYVLEHHRLTDWCRRYLNIIQECCGGRNTPGVRRDAGKMS